MVRNTGDCPLTIDSITALGDLYDDEFSVQAPTQFPIVLPPGEETLGVTIRFTPQELGNPLAPDEYRGELAIVSDDPDAGKLSVDLRFQELDDFDPDRVANQIPALRKLLELRQQLADVRGSLQGNEKLEEILAMTVGDEEKLAQLKAELGSEGDDSDG